jgi:U3 small nucleolar RNA-associated protein 18
LGAFNQPQPAVTKSFMQLRTPVSTLAFHPSGELLVTASKDEKDQMRLLHVGSGSAFGNWPTPRTPLRRVQAVAFSPSGAYMVAGNNAGRVLLWRLNHYS